MCLLHNRQTAAALQSLEEDWNDFLHYTMIGRLDLAKGYAQAILQGNPNPVALFERVQQNPQGYDFAMKVAETSRDEELAKVTQQLLGVIDQGQLPGGRIRRSWWRRSDGLAARREGSSLPFNGCGMPASTVCRFCWMPWPRPCETRLPKTSWLQ